MLIPRLLFSAFTATALLMCPFLLHAGSPTENYGLRLLPAPKDIKIDGKTNDWNLAAGIFASSDPEATLDNFAVWIHGAYDAENLYVLARFLDKTPMNNPGDTKLDFGWNGDSLQMRIITNYEDPAKSQASNVTCWTGRDGASVVELDSPGKTKHSPKGDDIKPFGAQQAFAKNPDGSGYTQEIAIPWKLLAKDGSAPKAGDSIVLTVEPNFTLGGNGRISVKDIFRPGQKIDRMFTFNAKRVWGIASLLLPGSFEPQPVRLADGRTFPVKMENGTPVVDWSGLVSQTSFKLPGFLPIQFTLPSASNVSIIIKNDKGQVVRNLLNSQPLSAGEHILQWDGLTTPYWRTPGSPVVPGKYTWSGIYHSGIGVKWRGVASNSGNVPWNDGPGTDWGGDAGNPCALATEGNFVLLGWGAAEAGKAAILCDLNGHSIWNTKRGGFGGATFVGLDGGIATICDGSIFYKLRVDSTAVEPWTRNGAGEATFNELLGGEKGLPARAQGFAVKNGKIYLSSSDYNFIPNDITDWRGLLSKASASDGDPLWTKLPLSLQNNLTSWLKLSEAGTKPLDQQTRSVVVHILNELLKEATLNENHLFLTGSKLVEINRHLLESRYPEIMPRVTGFVGIVDAKSGNLERKVALPGASILAADKGGVFAIVDGDSIVYIHSEGDTPQTVLKNLKNARALALDHAGNFYVGVGAPDNQIQVYSPNGQRLREIGRKGGFTKPGPWLPDAFRTISALAVDDLDHLWVAENDPFPRRFSSWEAQTGKLLGEYFGSAHYGASGGAILPEDPNVMVGESCEWRLDPVTGMASCTGVIDDEGHACARFAKGSNGRIYLAVAVPGFLTVAKTSQPTIKIFERIGPGQYKLRSTIARTMTGTVFWADTNDDQQVQPDEVQTTNKAFELGGYYFWSMNLNADMTLDAGSLSKSFGAMQFKVRGFTACGAPIYDVEGAKPLPPVRDALSSLDNRWLLAMGDPIQLYDTTTGNLCLSYPNNWAGVHGSHQAPPPEPGLLRGTFGIIGSAHLPEPIGDLWAINTNVGEWHLLTSGGYYLSRLFQPDQMKVKYPSQATPGADMTNGTAGLGGEDFGGSLMQGTDGKVYIQAGKTGFWNMELTGLETVKALSGGSLEVTDGDVKKAVAQHEEQMQESTSGLRRLEIRKLTPSFTGDLDLDFKKAEVISYKKADETAVRSALAWDEQNLYLAWEVSDQTPWINSADRAEYLYKHGDTVDFQIGSDPSANPKRAEAVAGDLRLSIGPLAGKTMAVIYRRVASGPGMHPFTFSSGVVREYVMQDVRLLPDAHIETKIDEAGKKYVVEAAIPFTSLGFQPKPDFTLRGDIGVTHGNPGGTETRLRTYWSNHVTGLVDDAVFELGMEPKNWGEFSFQP